jgi:tRNA (guanine37-N1)-methyltransferase
MRLGVISLFPDMFDAITQFGVSGRAVRNGLLTLSVWNPRDFTYDKHRTVDDRPYGGGPGMVMKLNHCERPLMQQKLNWVKTVK